MDIESLIEYGVRMRIFIFIIRSEKLIELISSYDSSKSLNCTLFSNTVKKYASKLQYR